MAKNKGGWLKLYRDILNSDVFEDPQIFKLWIYLLCSACYTEHDAVFNGSSVHLNEGELICGRKSLAHTLNISESKIYRSLQFLKKAGKIQQVTTKKYSIITVINWKLYQNEFDKTDWLYEPSVNISRTSDEHQTNIKRTSGEHIIKKKKGKREEGYILLQNDDLPDELERLTWEKLSNR